MLYSFGSPTPFARTLGEVPMRSTETSEENSIVLTLNARLIKPPPTALLLPTVLLLQASEKDEEETLFLMVLLMTSFLIP
jgi:hypothetical protein